MRSAIFLVLLSTSCTAQMVGSFGGYVGGNGSQTNNPVTMVFEHKQVQTLADGTHITQVTHETFYRDTLGRTRMEHESGLFGLNSGTPMRGINVTDPVAQTFTNWQTGGPGNMPHEYFRSEMNRPMPRIQNTTADSATHQVVPVQPAQHEQRPMPKHTTEQLGTQDVQGIPCEATRTTTVYPLNFMGNDRPITALNESCRSREFGRNLSESVEDPRTGTRTTTLQSISRGEPDPSLFQPPPDYTERQQQH